MAAGLARLAAVHFGQPVELHDWRQPEFALGLCAGRRAVGATGPVGPAMATTRPQAPVAPGRTDHVRSADRTDVHRQPWRAGASGNVDPEPGSTPENLPDPLAGHRRTPHR